MSGTGTAAGLAMIRDDARRLAPDRFYAALFAPSAARDDLIALAAFTGEIERIAQTASDPMAGAIRLQWWQDALTKASASLTGSPVADAFAGVIRRRSIPVADVAAYLDAQSDVVEGAVLETDGALVARIDATQGVPFHFAYKIVGDGTAQGDAALQLAGRAYGFTRLVIDLPHALARGVQPLPASRAPSPYIEHPDWHAETSYLIGEAQSALDKLRPLQPLEPAVRTALLPVALVEPYLRVLQKRGHNPARDLGDLAPLTRLVRLGFANLTGRV